MLLNEENVNTVIDTVKNYKDYHKSPVKYMDYMFTRGEYTIGVCDGKMVLVFSYRYLEDEEKKEIIEALHERGLDVNIVQSDTGHSHDTWTVYVSPKK